MYESIKREKLLQDWNQQKQVELIDKFNPEGLDLFHEVI